jgi:hypothetical protein
MDQRTPIRRRNAKQTTWGGLAIALLIAVYSFARPILNDRMGWDLPAMTGNSTAVADPKAADAKKPAPGPLAARVPNPQALESQSRETTDSTKATLPNAPATSTATKSVPATSNKSASTTLSTSTLTAPVDNSQLLYGLLKDLGGDRYVTPAGLMFTRGSAEGHRLEHLKRHTEDDPSRPGKHGVFDGGMEGALKTIDRAYERAKTGSRTTKEIDQGRTIYTVDMGSRVGYIGGRDGNRQKKPMARRVRLVLDQNRVITAFPL